MLIHKFSYLVFVLIFLQSCASTTAPKNWLSSPEDMAKQAYGSWVSVKLNQGCILAEALDSPYFTAKLYEFRAKPSRKAINRLDKPTVHALELLQIQDNWYLVMLNNGQEGWVHQTGIELSTHFEYHGELIAIGADTLFMLTPDYFLAIPENCIQEAILTAYNSKSEPLATTTTVGMLSTISHGFLLLFSAPVWLIGGSMATASESNHTQEKYLYPKQKAPIGTIKAFAKYARFPQGLPKNLNRKLLHPKPF